MVHCESTAERIDQRQSCSHKKRLRCIEIFMSNLGYKYYSYLAPNDSNRKPLVNRVLDTLDKVHLNRHQLNYSFLAFLLRIYYHLKMKHCLRRFDHILSTKTAKRSIEWAVSYLNTFVQIWRVLLVIVLLKPPR